jgi:hypothetical protein
LLQIVLKLFEFLPVFADDEIEGTDLHALNDVLYVIQDVLLDALCILGVLVDAFCHSGNICIDGVSFVDGLDYLL